MKKIINKIAAVIAALLLIIATTTAQKSGTEKTDKLTFLNGTVKEGKVLAFTDEKIKFVHSGETLNYEFSKREIEKIEYSSGRTEIITAKKIAEPVTVDSKHRVAVIPLQYTGFGDDSRKEDMGFYLQEIAISYLTGSAAELKFADAANVNAVLLKNGIADSNIRKYTPKELATLLHVEYVIMGSVLQDNGNLVTHTSGDRTRRESGMNYGDGDYKRRDNFSQSIITSQHVQTQVSVSVYNDTGESIYTKSRRSILSEKDAYKNALHYLLKRTPLFKR